MGAQAKHEQAVRDAAKGIAKAIDFWISLASGPLIPRDRAVVATAFRSMRQVLVATAAKLHEAESEVARRHPDILQHVGRMPGRALLFRPGNRPSFVAHDGDENLPA
jgi:hypothetical protein